MSLDFVTTPDDAQSLAIALYNSGFFAGKKVLVEKAIDERAPMRTTFVGTWTGPTVLVEVQKNPRYTGALRELAIWLRAERSYTTLYVATSHADNVSAEQMMHIKRDGSGLLVIDETGEVSTIIQPSCPALLVTPDPTLRLGPLKSEVHDLVRRFNDGDRKDGLRDMCEAVERETSKLLRKAISKGIITMTQAQADRADWSSKIDALASANQHAGGMSPTVSPELKNDLHSLRGARNKLDHPPKSAKEAANRERQYTERMMMGTRLLADLVRVSRSLK